MKRFAFFLVVFCLASVSLTCMAEETTVPATHVIVSPEQVQWQASQFPDVMIAVMQGAPDRAGEPFTLWIKIPAGYTFAPHWHPTDESVIVLQGTLGMGTGDTFDATKGKEMGPGSYARIAREVHHFAWSKDGASFAVYGIGPFQVTYVNPADDPRPKATK